MSVVPEPVQSVETIEHEGRTLRVLPIEVHDAQCEVRVASPQGTTPEVLHCHFCGFCYPRPAKIADPEWCTRDHAEDDERDDLVLHTGDDHTDGIVRRLLDVTTLDAPARGGAKLDIRVMRTDNLTEGRAGTPVLRVHATDVELTTWEQAAELARAILDGFGYLHGA